jgi:predicted acyl esterase
MLESEMGKAGNMMDGIRPNPDSLRTAYPQAHPQYPYNSPPATRERSEPIYSIRAETDQRIVVRDGTRLALDVYRPGGRPGDTFPALVGFSPYTRQLQQTNVPLGQNEAGIKEFWVPRGYAQVFVDVRGSNDSEGGWDMFGPTEQADLVDIIEWVGSQPWCNGSVGMMGASYYGRTQIMAAELQPPSLKAIFAYDAATDAYRDTFFHGGIPSEGMQRTWLSAVYALNMQSGRLKNRAAMQEKITTIVGLKYPLDCEFYQERSTWPRLDRVKIPVYFGCNWGFWNLHLRGAFSGWMGINGVPKRMLIGPEPNPRRPVAEYHLEMLRWYDHWLKGMDTGVMDGPPIQLWIRGENTWRSEDAWPLASTEWRELYLGGAADGLEGTLDWSPGSSRERGYDYVPGTDDWLWGRPRLVYRTPPLEQELEITGPVQLDLWITSTGKDTDFFVTLNDESPDGSVHLLTKGWLRASHRTIDPSRSRPNQPWHPHKSLEELTPGEPAELPIEVISTCNVFKPGHRVRLEIASCDSMAENPFWYHRALLNPARNVVLEGGVHASKLCVPVIPR